MRLAAALVGAGLALAPCLAAAQSYRCTGQDGKKYYGSTVPAQCLGLPVEELGPSGMVVRRFDAAASAAEREKKAADEEERKKREAVTKEEGRRNRALLATYTSERDIDEARRRTLAENQKTTTEVQLRIEGIRKDQVRLTKELEFYSGKNKPPAKLTEELKNTEIDVKAQEDLLEAKKREITTINAKYDDDKKRYIELTRASNAGKK